MTYSLPPSSQLRGGAFLFSALLLVVPAQVQAKPVNKPVAKQVKKVAKKPAVKPLAKPVVKPVAKPVEQPVAEPLAEPTVVEPTPKPDAKPDLSLRPQSQLPDGPWVGEDTESTTENTSAPTSPAQVLPELRKPEQSYVVRLKNTGTDKSAFDLELSPPTPGHTLNLFATPDATNPIVFAQGRWHTPVIGPGSSIEMRLEVTSEDDADTDNTPVDENAPDYMPEELRPKKHFEVKLRASAGENSDQASVVLGPQQAGRIEWSEGDDVFHPVTGTITTPINGMRTFRAFPNFAVPGTKNKDGWAVPFLVWEVRGDNYYYHYNGNTIPIHWEILGEFTLTLKGSEGTPVKIKVVPGPND